jgi:hypothetical protein
VAQTQDQRRASRAVSAWLAHHERNTAWLVRQTEADPGTIGDFLNGNRWPKFKTQGRIEKALGWAAGTLTAIADGDEVPELGIGESGSQEGAVGGDTQDAQQFVESLTGERLQWSHQRGPAAGDPAKQSRDRPHGRPHRSSVESGLGALSERVAKLEEPRA